MPWYRENSIGELLTVWRPAHYVASSTPIMMQRDKRFDVAGIGRETLCDFCKEVVVIPDLTQSDESYDPIISMLVNVWWLCIVDILIGVVIAFSGEPVVIAGGFLGAIIATISMHITFSIGVMGVRRLWTISSCCVITTTV